VDYGLFIMPQHPPARPVADTYDDDLQTIIAADRLGYAEAWIGEHFTSAWENIPCPDLVIAKAAGLTERIRLGTGVVLMPFHNPLEVALRFATLDNLTRGRLMLGVGSGGINGDRRAFGIELSGPDAAALTREGIDVIVKAWAGEPFRHEGRFFKYDVPEPDHTTETGVLLRPYQHPHPPIGIAGVSRNSAGLALAGERGYIPMSTNFLQPDVLSQHWSSVESGAARSGRTPSRRDWRIAREIYVAESHDHAQRDARDGAMARAFREYMLPLVASGPYGLSAFKPMEGDVPDEAITIDYLIENVWIVGTPDECVAQLQHLYEAVGGFGTVLMIGHDWYPEPEKWTRSMELFAEKVMPRLKNLRPD
jgi:alkanesulfonate monooxygenase SsuD/methylene tetrahydromethanopterin reductase-like flavin-dependent oxidoreductase (luciferase family)